VALLIERRFEVDYSLLCSDGTIVYSCLRCGTNDLSPDLFGWFSMFHVIRPMSLIFMEPACSLRWADSFIVLLSCTCVSYRPIVHALF
jgi:hypothetical protein